MSLFCPMLYAETIVFSGSIHQKTCEIAINGNASGLMVLLPAPMRLSTGRVFGNTPFSIEARNCAAKDGKARLVAEIITTKENIQNTSGTANNIAIKVVTRSSSVTNSSFSADVKVDSSGKASIPYTAKYYSTGDVSHGSVVGATSFLVVYN